MSIYIYIYICYIYLHYEKLKVKINLNELKIKDEKIQNKLMVTKGERGGRDKIGVWVEHTHTTIHKIDNQQEPTI